MMAELAGALRLPCARRTGVAGGGVAPRLRLRGVAADAAGVRARALFEGAGVRAPLRAPSSEASEK